ncbi:uncharacterized protein LOC100678155 [Nasonia vitripennis]|uniref:MYND-type domain-containing protein n=1 Tax=Nasonia vitripennis TaxID=7425 RepID=A0A7M7GE19_NASVI|nr:uncharacterized protein LOC100678155 [Nasonia vitripennis]
MNKDNEDRYCDYPFRLQEISGLPSDFIRPDVLPVREIPHKTDPRRDRSLQHVLDLQRTWEENNPPLRDKPVNNDIPWKLRRIDDIDKKSIKLADTAHMPHCRDPRRAEIVNPRPREGEATSTERPRPPTPNLVENFQIQVELATCPILTVDLTEWPETVHSYIDVIPHECNILRAELLASSPKTSEQLVDVDNENVNILLETMRRRENNDDVEIVEDDDVTEVSGYNSGDTTKPMLSMNDANRVYDVELPLGSFLGDEELPPIPVVKPEPKVVRPVPSYDESNIDLVDLCDDDDEDVRPLLPKRERSSSIVCGVLEVITLDSDDDVYDDGANNRGDASVLEESITPAEQHMDSTSRVSDRPRIPSFPRGQQESAGQVLLPAASGNGVVNSNTATASQSRQVLLDEVNSMHVDAEICEVRDNDAISAAGRNRTWRHLDDARINEVQKVVEFDEIWDSMKETDWADDSIIFRPNNNETGDGDINSDKKEPEFQMECETTNEARENFDNEPCLLNNNKTDDDEPAPRRISIVTSDAFHAQKKLLIDVISHANDDMGNDSEYLDILPSPMEETKSQQTTPENVTTEQLQRVINDMTSANYLGRSIFANCSPIEDITLACPEKRKTREKGQEFPEQNSEEVPEPPEKERRTSERKESLDQDENTVVSKPSEQPVLKVNTPATVPNVSTAIKLFHQSKSMQYLPTRDNAPPLMTSTIFNFDQALLNHLINYVRNFNIERSSIEFMLHDYGGLSVTRAMQVVNETFWRNRYNHWSHHDWDRSISTESSDLLISEDTIDILPQDDQIANNIDASYFLKYPGLKANKPAIESDMQTISQDSRFYSDNHALQTNTKIRRNTNLESKTSEFDTIGSKSEIKKIKKRHSLPTAIDPHTNFEFQSSVFDTIESNSDIKKIKKRHSLPTAIVPQCYSFSKRPRSKSYDSCNSHNKSISPIKLTLTRDQSNQQNWFASTKKSPSISEYNNLGKRSHKLNCFTENVKTSCHLTIGFTKNQSCSDKIVPELENNDYISKPIISDKFIGKQSLEKHLSPFLKSRVKRPHQVTETVDMLQSNFTSKRPKLSEQALDANINININYINNHLGCMNKQDIKSVELSQSFSDFSKKDLSKSFKNNVSNLNISLSYSDTCEKHNVLHIRSESNGNVQIDHNSNIAKNSHKVQKISSPKRKKSPEQNKRGKRTSVEMNERKKMKIGQKFAEIFGDSDSDALEIICSPSNFALSEKALSKGNYIDSDDSHHSDANCETNVIVKQVTLNKHDINATLEKLSKVSEIESVLNTAEKCIKMATNDLVLDQSEHSSSSIQENQDFEESLKLTESKTLGVNESSKLSTRAVHPNKSDKNSMLLEKIETNTTINSIARLISEKTSNTSLKTSENNIEICESSTEPVTINVKANELADKCVSKVQSNVSFEHFSSNTSEISLSKTTEINSPTSITEETSSKVTSEDQVEIHESTTIIAKTNEFVDKSANTVQSDLSSDNTSSSTTFEVTSEDRGLCNLNGTNCDSSKDETMDLQEGDFDFQVDNRSVCSYDDCLSSDTAESEDLTCSYSVKIQGLGNDESTNNSKKPKNQQLLVSKRSEVTAEQNNTYCFEKSPTYINECGIECVRNEISDSTGANNEKTKDFNSYNAEGSFDYDSDNQLIICESPVQNEVSSSTISFPNQNSPITFGNSNNINKETSLLSSIDAAEPIRTGASPDKTLLADLKDPNILKKYNLFLEEVPSETFTESIENQEELEAFESLKKINDYLENATYENIIEEHSNQSLNEQLKNSIEEFKKFNIHCIDIDADEVINATKSIDNSNSTVRNFSGTFKVRNINELLEKPQTNIDSALSQTNIDSVNEKTAGKVVKTQSEEFSNIIESIYNSISSSLEQLILIVKSISFTKQIHSPVGIKIIPNTVSQLNNQSCENVLPVNLSQSTALSNNSRVCIKLASNMFSNEFSTTDDLPTIYSMESPLLDTLQVLMPALRTKEDVEKYKKLLISKLDSHLELLQNIPRKDLVRFSDDLLKYNTLSEKTWEFQQLILTIMQCISRLIYCAVDENKQRIIQIIEKTINLSKYKQVYLGEAIILYQKLATQGLCHKYIFLYDPLTIEFDVDRSSMPDKDFKMNDSQMTIYFQQITSYRSLQKLPHLEVSDLKVIASKPITTHQINSFQSFSTNNVQMTVSNLRNAQISQQVQYNQTTLIPSCVPQSTGIQVPPVPMPRNPLIQQVCSTCKKASTLMIICYCKNVIYCSPSCHKRDWINHAKICKSNMFMHRQLN